MIDEQPSSTAAARMARFDALPPAMRKAIREAKTCIHPVVGERLLQKGLDDAQCASVLMATDLHLSGGARQ